MKYQRLKNSNDSLERWLVSYADYMTLLFAVFVVLYAMAIVNEEKFKYTLNELKETFSGLGFYPEQLGGDKLVEGKTKELLFEGGFFEGGDDIVQGSESLGEDGVTGQEQIDAPEKLSSLGKDKLGASLAQVESELQQVISPLTNSGMIDVESTDDWIMIEMNSRLAFPSGSATLTNPARKALQELMPILGPLSNFIRIRGFTDNEQVESEIYRTNWQLAGERAYSVLEQLQKMGVNPYRLAYESYGSFSPVASNRTPEGRQQNRRVVIAISKFGWDGLTGEERYKEQEGQE